MAEVSGALTVSQGQQKRWAMLGGIGLAVLVVVSYAVAATTDPTFGFVGDTVSRVVAGVIGAGGVLASIVSWSTSPHGMGRKVTMTGLGLVSSLVLWFLYLTDASMRATFHSVIIALAVSAVIFVAANKWFDASLKNWLTFSVISGAVVLGGLAALLVGNRAIGLFAAGADYSWVLVPVLALLGAALGVGLSRSTSGSRKVLVGAVGGTVVGLVPGLFFRSGSLPALEVLPLVAATVVGAAIGAGLGQLRRKQPIPGALTGAAVGWLLGAFGIPDLGTGSIVEAIVGTAVLGLLVGLRLGVAPDQTMEARIKLDQRARVVIFLGPALVFIAATLIIPTIRTGWLSLLDRRSVEFVGLAQYQAAFSNPNFWNTTRWAGAFNSTEFVVFAALMTAALGLMLLARSRIDRYYPPRLAAATGSAAVLTVVALIGRAGRGEDLTVAGPLTYLAVLVTVGMFVAIVMYFRAHPGNSGISGSSGGALSLAVIFLSLALFVHLRGVLFNNLWWVFMVTAVTTGVGLAVAAISDGTKGESLAKSLIFMPMAISFVGAGIIWRFMYIARPPVQDQTGVLNAAWVWLGEYSVSDGATTGAIVAFVVAALLALFGVRGFLAGSLSVGWTSVLVAIPFAWFGTRLLAGDIGGVVEGPGGQMIADPILFLSGTQQVGAYNNVFVMLPFIWIYTGFAMVIFSAAIKGVPSDLLDAANVDGASRSQMFWRVIVPQIAPTIGVVITTVIVVVMKVFDIVKVMTAGNFGTNVLANLMWDAAFTDRNFGLGSAIAIMLFISVLPIMYINIRRMQKEFH